MPAPLEIRTLREALSRRVSQYTMNFQRSIYARAAPTMGTVTYDAYRPRR